MLAPEATADPDPALGAPKRSPTDEYESRSAFHLPTLEPVLTAPALDFPEIRVWPFLSIIVTSPVSTDELCVVDGPKTLPLELLLPYSLK